MMASNAFSLKAFDIPALHGSYRAEIFTSVASEPGNKIAIQFKCLEGLNIIIGFFLKESTLTAENSIFEVVFGAWGKWAVLLRKQGQAVAVSEIDTDSGNISVGTDAASASDSGAEQRPGSPPTASDYWVVIGEDGSLAAGKHSVIGEGTLLTLPGNQETAQSTKVLPDVSAFFSSGDRPLAISDVAFKFWDGQVSEPLMEVNMMYEAGAESSSQQGATDNDELQAEQQKAQQRAERFGIECKAQDQKNIFAWTEYKKMMKLRERKKNPGLALGIGFDLSSPEEREKAQRRKERFGLSKGDEEIDEKEEAIKKAKRAARFGIPLVTAKPIWQQLKLRVKHVYREDPFRADPPPESEAKRCPDKVHIHSLDATFKQIRSKDILYHFQQYGATYVEWLTDISCNVCLPNPSTAARVMDELSADLPPLPAVKENQGENSSTDKSEKKKAPPVDLAALGWRLGKTRLKKIRSDRWGNEGITVRYLLRIATVEDILLERPPPKRPISEVQINPELEHLESFESIQKDYGLEDEDEIGKALPRPAKRQRKDKKQPPIPALEESSNHEPQKESFQNLDRVEVNTEGFYTKRNLVPATSMFGHQIKNHMDAQAVLEQFANKFRPNEDTVVPEQGNGVVDMETGDAVNSEVQQIQHKTLSSAENQINGTEEISVEQQMDT